MSLEILPNRDEVVNNFTLGIKYAGIGILMYCAGTGASNLISGIGDAFRSGTINKVEINVAIDQETQHMDRVRMDVLKIALQDMSPIERRIVALELAKSPYSGANSYLTTK